MSDQKDQIIKAADLLAKNSENELRAAQWRSLIHINASDNSLSDSMLLLAGATLALIVPNLKDLLDVIDLFPLKVGIILFLLSAIFGLRAKYTRKEILEDLTENSKLGDEVIQITEKYFKKFNEFNEKAKALNFTLEIKLKLIELFKPLDTVTPNSIKKVGKELSEREKDPDRKWRLTFKASENYTFFISIQLALLVFGVVVLMASLRLPNV